MTRLNVNPTRVQLKTLRARLKTATRGHKLLKDKLDEMIRNYNKLVKKNYLLRIKYEKLIREVLQNFCLAKSFMSKQEIENLFGVTTLDFLPRFESKNILNIEVPVINFETCDEIEFPYSYIDSNPLIDNIIEQMRNLMPKIFELASIEKTCQILASQIEYTKRQVNSLENMTIPQLEETIKYIVMKIEENDRSSRIRQLKVKSIIKEDK